MFVPDSIGELVSADIHTWPLVGFKYSQFFATYNIQATGECIDVLAFSSQQTLQLLSAIHSTTQSKHGTLVTIRVFEVGRSWSDRNVVGLIYKTKNADYHRASSCANANRFHSLIVTKGVDMQIGNLGVGAVWMENIPLLARVPCGSAPSEVLNIFIHLVICFSF